MHLPALREPVGWRSLDERELASRAMVLFEVATARGDGALSSEVPATAPVAARPVPAPPEQEPTAGAAAMRGGVGPTLALPGLVLLGGLAMSAPVLVWAPLVGGLCVGIAVLQAGVVKKLLERRAALKEEALSRHAEVDLAQTVSAPARSRMRQAQSGVLLTAFLVLFGLLAAVVLTTLDIKNREPAAAAEALRQKRPLELPATPGATLTPEKGRKTP